MKTYPSEIEIQLTLHLFARLADLRKIYKEKMEIGQITAGDAKREMEALEDRIIQKLKEINYEPELITERIR